MPDQDAGVNVPVDLASADTVPLAYANFFVLQKGQHEVVLSCFSVAPPVVVGSPEEMAEKLQGRKAPTHCVARLAIPQEVVHRLAEILRPYASAEELQTLPVTEEPGPR